MYDAWGNIQVGTDPDLGYVAQQGYYYDDTLKLYYVRQRWYDQEAKRWVSPDPDGFGDGTNFYEMANSRPTVLVDPDGTTPKPATGPPIDPRQLRIRPPPWATKGEARGALIRSGVVALANHDKKNHDCQKVVFNAPFYQIRFCRYERIGTTDLKIGYLNETAWNGSTASNNQPDPAPLATIKPNDQELVFWMDQFKTVYTARFTGTGLSGVSTILRLDASAHPPIAGDSGSPVWNHNGELLGVLSSGGLKPTLNWIYAALNGNVPKWKSFPTCGYQINSKCHCTSRNCTDV